jgi:hypothetical protein
MHACIRAIHCTHARTHARTHASAHTNTYVFGGRQAQVEEGEEAACDVLEALDAFVTFEALVQDTTPAASHAHVPAPPHVPDGV